MKTNSSYYNETNFNTLNFYPGLNLEALPTGEQNEFERHSKIYQVKNKTQIYREGEPPKGIYIIKKGKVKFFNLNADGSEQIFFIYSAGDIFGYRPILGGTTNMHSVTAIDDCEYYFVEKETFQSMLKNSDYLTELFLNSMIKDFVSLTNMINIITHGNIRERTAFFLLVVNEKFKLPGQVMDEAEIKLSRGDLASYVGASIENLIRVVRDFKDRDYIRLEGRSIYIKDFAALQSFLDFQIAS